MNIDVAIGWFNFGVFLVYAFILDAVVVGILALFSKGWSYRNAVLNCWLITLGGGLAVTLSILTFKWWSRVSTWLPSWLNASGIPLTKLASLACFIALVGLLVWLVRGLEETYVSEGFAPVAVSGALFLGTLWAYGFTYEKLGIAVPLMTRQIFAWFSWLFTNS
ncbi:MAG: hypothetical protein RL681_88 [Candidatus Parcubacteria bacterium]|jgi:hypothetical protein